MNSSSLSVVPTLPVDILSNGTNLAGATDAAKIKSACKAIEGLFTGQLLSEIGKSATDGSSDPAGGQYQDFIQQALAQGVTNGGGFGLAKTLESSLLPHSHLNAHTLHASTTPPASS